MLTAFIEELKRVKAIHLFTVGRAPITLGTLLYLAVVAFLLFYLSEKLRRLLVERIRWGRNIDVGVRQAVGAILRYAVIAVGLVVILQTAGIDLSMVTVLAGTLGIGVGFGLQSMVNNVVSGFIILFERPVKVGDRVEVGGVAGQVVEVALRASTIVTNDNITIIVPNSQFTQSAVTNWSYSGRKVRFRFPVPVSYKEDAKRVRALLLEVADSHPAVLKEPKPDVMLDNFGESRLNFVLRVWTRDYSHRPGLLRSEINYLILEKFNKAQVEMPFPQRVIHMQNGQDLRVPVPALTWNELTRE